MHYAFGRGFLFGFLYYVGIYYWFIWFFPFDYANLPDIASIGVVALAWFGISAVHGLLWCIPFVCCHLMRKLTKNRLFLSAFAILLIIAIQKIVGLGELSFPWARISLGQYKATTFIQSAAIVGIDGVDMLILWINALLALCVVCPTKKRVIAGSVALALFVANMSFGLIRLSHADRADNSLTILTAQASVPTEKKWADDGDVICYDIYSDLTKNGFTDDVDLILWPESAIPKIYTSTEDLKHYETISEELGTPILAGIILGDEKHNTNNTLLIDKGGVKAVYTKRKLVPFGEYMPYAKLLSRAFPMLTELNIVEDDYIAGTDSAVMETLDCKIGNIICFESIYPDLTRQSVLDGAQLIIEASNDSWLETSPAMQQHLAHGVFRSIENGRYLVRTTNSGISAVITFTGEIEQTLAVNEIGTLKATVNLHNNKTIYTLHGNIAFKIYAAIMLAWWIIYLSKFTINKIKE